jgi:hypothetical protein
LLLSPSRIFVARSIESLLGFVLALPKPVKINNFTSLNSEQRTREARKYPI